MGQYVEVALSDFRNLVIRGSNLHNMSPVEASTLPFLMFGHEGMPVSSVYPRVNPGEFLCILENGSSAQTLLPLLSIAYCPSLHLLRPLQQSEGEDAAGGTMAGTVEGGDAGGNNSHSRQDGCQDTEREKSISWLPELPLERFHLPLNE